jgi:hypothetical protein
MRRDGGRALRVSAELAPILCQGISVILVSAAVQNYPNFSDIKPNQATLSLAMRLHQNEP